MKLVWLIFLAGCTADIDPCLHYKTLDAKVRDRSVETGDTPICDANLTPGWYRFSSGEIAMSQVPARHCGTINPISMVGLLPEPGKQEEREFCFTNVGVPGPGCLWKKKTSVKNCGRYAVYKFPIPSTLCPMAVCADIDHKPCEKGTVSKTGFTPCKSTSPVIKKVTLTGPEEITQGQYMHICTVTSNDTEPDARYRVTWSMEGVPVSTEILSGLEREANFTLDQWEGHINQHLTCSAVAYYENLKNQTSKTVTSNRYFGGIKVDPTPVVVTEGTDKEVDVISTLPLNCEDPLQHDMCQLNLHAISSGIYTPGGCGLTITPTDWDPTNHEARVPFKISSKVDPAHNPYFHSDLAFRISLNGTVPGMQIWANASEVNSKVTVQDAVSKYCTTVADPHVTRSFSQSSRYDLYHQGDFNFASDMRVPIVIQVENTALHSSYLPMVSAVAVQTGDDVTIVDTFGGRRLPSITSRKEPASHTVMTCGTREYQIVASTGHRVEIIHLGTATAGYLDVSVYFPAGYRPYDGSNTTRHYYEVCDAKAMTEGQSSFDTRFHRSALSDLIIDGYRVDPSENLFKGEVLPLNNVTREITQYCSCTRNNVDQTVQATCSTTQKIDDPVIKRRGCDVIIPPRHPPFPKERPNEFEWHEYIPQPKRWPTRSGITESQARAACRGAILKHVSPQCIRIPGISVDSDVDDCVEDVLATGGYDFMGGAIHSFQAKCEAAILTDRNNYHSGLPAILSEKCPGFCSLHGDCVNGKCQCETGWEYDDCSVYSLDPFVIMGINGGILCDKSVSKDCFKPVLQFYNLRSIKNCTIQAYKYHEGRPGGHPVGNMYNGQHKRQTATSAVCDIESAITNSPAAKSMKNNYPAMEFRIGLESESSNQNPEYIDYVVYDGTCQQCLVDKTCFMKQDSCLIGERCYSLGDTKPGTSLTCDPDVNMDGWTSH